MISTVSTIIVAVTGLLVVVIMTLDMLFSEKGSKLAELVAQIKARARGPLLVLATLYLGLLAVTFGLTRLSSVSYEPPGGLRVQKLCVSWRLVCSERIFSYVISPTGWQRTEITVKAGQQLHFHAQGMATIAFTELMETVVRRRNLEDERKARGLDPDAFTPEEERSLRPGDGFDWTGPEGSARAISETKPGRERSLALPSANYGALLGAITQKGGNAWPDSSEIFQVLNRGPSRPIPATSDGNLWLAVNDVGYYSERHFRWPRYWDRDNVGFFQVFIVIKD